MLTSEEFKIGNKVVYPAHGIGVIINEEWQKIGGIDLAFLVIEFTKDKMRLSIPTRKAVEVGLRHLSEKTELIIVYEILGSKAKITKGMWSRRAQEYEAKINSGSIGSLAEVIRDLFKNTIDPNRSYSEKNLYDAALSKLIAEIAVVEEIDEKEAEAKILSFLPAQEAA